MEYISSDTNVWQFNKGNFSLSLTAWAVFLYLAKITRDVLKFGFMDYRLYISTESSGKRFGK